MNVCPMVNWVHVRKCAPIQLDPLCAVANQDTPHQKITVLVSAKCKHLVISAMFVNLYYSNTKNNFFFFFMYNNISTTIYKKHYI